MKIIQQRKTFYAISISLILASCFFLFTWGLNKGLDFTGGVLLEVSFEAEAPNSGEIKEGLAELELGSLTVQPTTDGNALIRFASQKEEANKQAQDKIKEKFEQAKIERVEFVSSTISTELKKNAIIAITLAIVGIALYIAWAFKGVSYPVKSWIYGLGAVVALAHDVLLTLGVFAILGKYYGVEVGVPFIAALLTILGYSVNDTIVVFDRIRENIKKGASGKDFENVVNKSINESLARSMNTSLTVILVLLAIIFLGGTSIKYFSLALMIGVALGTYSSIFVASSLVVTVWKRQLEAKK